MVKNMFSSPGKNYSWRCLEPLDVAKWTSRRPKSLCWRLRGPWRGGLRKPPPGSFIIKRIFVYVDSGRLVVFGQMDPREVCPDYQCSRWVGSWRLRCDVLSCHFRQEVRTRVWVVRVIIQIPGKSKPGVTLVTTHTAVRILHERTHHTRRSHTNITVCIL